MVREATRNRLFDQTAILGKAISSGHWETIVKIAISHVLREKEIPAAPTAMSVKT
jgi:hypothetical protein